MLHGGVGNLPILSQLSIVYSGTQQATSWLCHGSLWVPPGGGRYRETGWLERGEGTPSSLFACISSHFGSGSWFWLSASLGIFISPPWRYQHQVDSPTSKRSESRLPDPVGFFLRDPEILPTARSRPRPRDLSPSSEATLQSF